jgi:hypothetical protein
MVQPPFCFNQGVIFYAVCGYLGMDAAFSIALTSLYAKISNAGAL